MISIPKARMALLGEGVGGANTEGGNFRSGCKDDIARNFNRPEYAILRPSGFRVDLWQDDECAHRTIRESTITPLGGINLSTCHFR